MTHTHRPSFLPALRGGTLHIRVYGVVPSGSAILLADAHVPYEGRELSTMVAQSLVENRVGILTTPARLPVTILTLDNASAHVLVPSVVLDTPALLAA